MVQAKRNVFEGQNEIMKKKFKRLSVMSHDKLCFLFFHFKSFWGFAFATAPLSPLEEHLVFHCF